MKQICFFVVGIVVSCLLVIATGHQAFWLTQFAFVAVFLATNRN